MEPINSDAVVIFSDRQRRHKFYAISTCVQITIHGAETTTHNYARKLLTVCHDRARHLSSMLPSGHDAAAVSIVTGIWCVHIAFSGQACPFFRTTWNKKNTKYRWPGGNFSRSHRVWDTALNVQTRQLTWETWDVYQENEVAWFMMLQWHYSTLSCFAGLLTMMMMFTMMLTAGPNCTNGWTNLQKLSYCSDGRTILHNSNFRCRVRDT